MSSSVWVLAALLIGALFGLVALALARRRASRPLPDAAGEAPAIIPEPSREPEPLAVEQAPAAAKLEPDPLDPAQLAARNMAKSAYDIAQHLGFEAMPDRAQPSMRKLRIPLRSDLEKRAAALLASGTHPCVPRVEIARDERYALTFIDLSALPPT